MNLVEIKPPEFDVDLYIAYATDDNVTGKKLYKNSYCYLHKDAAQKLKNAIALAASLDLRIKIFDAFRPLEAQQMLWDDNPDPNYISNPKTGATPHCRGVAIDLTLVDKSGKELDMGTGFDEFTTKSHHGRTDISQEAQINRYTLMGIMMSSGFDMYMNEWWHYQLFNCREYPQLSDKDAKTNML